MLSPGVSSHVPLDELGVLQNPLNEQSRRKVVLSTRNVHWVLETKKLVGKTPGWWKALDFQSRIGGSCPIEERFKPVQQCQSRTTCLDRQMKSFPSTL